MVNAGLVKATIIEDYIADFWKKIFPKLIPNPGATVRTGGEIAWMIRKDSPQLKAELDCRAARRREDRRETVTYVSNIYKYYLAYQMIEEERADREKAKAAAKEGAGK
jgi:hypothetical protein